MKTDSNIEEAKSALKAEIDRLPEYDAFGDSNEEAIAEMREWLHDLETGEPFTTETVRLWVNGEWSELSDILG